jgi:hypothetical protein
MTKSTPIPGLSGGELIAAGVNFWASLPRGSVALLPVPTRRGRRLMWAYLGVGFTESEAGERFGPIHGVCLVPADGGPVRRVPYQGPALEPFLVPVSPVSPVLLLRLRREISLAAASFFAGQPATHSAWMRVALRGAYPGPLWEALASVAPDFQAWLSAAPYDQADQAQG